MWCSWLYSYAVKCCWKGLPLKKLCSELTQLLYLDDVTQNWSSFNIWQVSTDKVGIPKYIFYIEMIGAKGFVTYSMSSTVHSHLISHVKQSFFLSDLTNCSVAKMFVVTIYSLSFDCSTVQAIWSQLSRQMANSSIILFDIFKACNLLIHDWNLV